uniref:Uncharacterized protein n=1 Tax=Setaria viridis TaxID=4556 RepID=A0A4U6V1S7_SETVI|nr:hypothetical protein SEVIR_4G176602v2 [Setaria viridis]
MLKPLSLLLVALGLPSSLLGGWSSGIPPRTARTGTGDVRVGLMVTSDPRVSFDLFFFRCSRTPQACLNFEPEL